MLKNRSLSSNGPVALFVELEKGIHWECLSEATKFRAINIVVVVNLNETTTNKICQYEYGFHVEPRILHINSTISEIFIKCWTLSRKESMRKSQKYQG